MISDILPDIRAGPICLNFNPEYIAFDFLSSESVLILYSAIIFVEVIIYDMNIKLRSFINLILFLFFPNVYN